MQTDAFIEFDRDTVERALSIWKWKFDPSNFEVLRVTLLGDCIVWTGRDIQILVGRECRLDSTRLYTKDCDEHLEGSGFQDKYLNINESNFLADLTTSLGPLASGHCYSPRLFWPAGGDYTEVDNFCIVPIDHYLSVSGMMFDLRERLPDSDWDRVDQLTGERRRINEVLNDSYPYFVSTKP